MFGFEVTTSKMEGCWEMNLAGWNYVYNGRNPVKEKSLFTQTKALCCLFLSRVAGIISRKAQYVVCTHTVSQNPITAEVIDTSSR